MQSSFLLQNQKQVLQPFPRYSSGLLSSSKDKLSNQTIVQIINKNFEMIMNQLVGLLVRITGTGIHSIMTMSIKKSYTQGVDHSSNQNNVSIS